MKAFVYREYGAGDGVSLEEVEKPAPADDQVLVRIRAASINAMDSHLMGGTYILRPMTGLRRPKPTSPGADFAGEVESAGKNVTLFEKGDRVFGVARGALAEYACAAENKIAPIPSNLTFEQAAAIPVAGLTALQGIRDNGKVHAGQQVLINGGSGGVGTFAVQIANALGAVVTAVCSTHNVELVRSIGADHVIDYTKEDFTRRSERYDVVYDNAGSRSFSDLRRVMKPDSILVPGGVRPGGKWLGPFPHLLGVFVSRLFASQKVVFFLGSINPGDLKAMTDLIEAGKVTPIIEKRFSFAEVPAALRYVKEGHARAKVVVTVV